MEFADVVRRRHMVRDFQPDRPVPPELRDRLLEHAIRAPSAGFSQGWAFLVLETPVDRDRFWRSTTSAEDEARMSDWLTRLRRAPLLIVPLASKQAYLDRYAEPDKPWQDRDEAHWPVPYWYVDTGMATLLVLLTAVDEGLAACFFGIQAAERPRFAAEFGVPAEWDALGCVAVGYAGDRDRRSPSLRRGRRGLEDVVHRGRW